MKDDSIKNERSSIEEDIKILEEMIENANIENMDMNNCFGGEHIEAIEYILSDYIWILKENKELLEVKVSASAHNRILELEKENEEYKKAVNVVNKEKADWIRAYQEEKDKQIDLMANHIATSYSDLCEYLDITNKCKYYAGDNGKTCNNCIKQYFENKAKELLNK